MSRVITSVDRAKQVFELAVSTSGGRTTGQNRLTRCQFERFWIGEVSSQ